MNGRYQHACIACLCFAALLALLLAACVASNLPSVR